MTETIEKAVQKVKDVRACQRMLPTEADFIGRKGYYRRYDKDGSGRYKWGFKYRPNVDGKWTKTGGEVLERMRPFWKADSARHQNLEQQKEKAKVRDSEGQVRYLDPVIAERTALAQGWAHVVSGRRSRVERGPDGMLFKEDRSGWRPLGRWCLSEPWSQGGRPKHGRKDGSMRSVGVQHDPEGVPWRWVEGEWRQL